MSELPKLEEEQPPEVRIALDKYPKGKTGIYIIRNGTRILLNKLNDRTTDRNRGTARNTK